MFTFSKMDLKNNKNISKCVNEKCNNNPFDNELSMVLATTDGDFACCEHCKNEFEKQRETFFNNIENDNWLNNWLNN